MDTYSPSEESACRAFKVSLDELTTVKKLRQTGIFQQNPKFNSSKYGDIFVISDKESNNISVHLYPQTATKRTAQPIQPQKRGRKGDKIINALRSVPNTPVAAESFSAAHNISIAVLRQAKRFTANLDQLSISSIGRVCVKTDKTTKTLMIWREDI
jgi:hypothetical protein